MQIVHGSDFGEVLDQFSETQSNVGQYAGKQNLVVEFKRSDNKSYNLILFHLEIKYKVS